MGTMSGNLSREMLKWIQSMDLTYPVGKNPKRDFANGYSVAEIFSRYYPQDVQMHSYDTGLSLKNKLGNWELLNKLFVKHHIPISMDLISDVIHCKPGAGARLIEIAYCFLTNKKIPSTKPKQELESPSGPTFARPTVSQLVKTSVTDSEMKAKKSPQKYMSEKAESIIEKHKSEQKTLLNSTSPLKTPSAHTSSNTILRQDSATPVTPLQPQRKPAVPHKNTPQRFKNPVPVQEHSISPNEQIEFKEVHIKPVDLNLLELRRKHLSSTPSTVEHD